MKSSPGRLPVVLAISGHDPTGGAGVQADIEAIAAAGAHCASLITCTTAQNTQEFAACYVQPADQLREAARLLLADMPVDACKIGLIAAGETADFISELLPRLPVPVVLDPVLRAGTGTGISDAAHCRKLLPLATIATPNAAECRALGGCDDTDEAARRLLAQGVRYVLVTGGDEATADVVDVLLGADGTRVEYRGTRLPHRYHGSGCTLASALAAALASGAPVAEAVARARAFTRRALERAHAFGAAQKHPWRSSGPS